MKIWGVIYTSQIYVMTMPRKEVSKHVLIRLLRIRSKRWQFGIEVGSLTGYEHYQIRYECSNNDYARERNFWTGYKCELQQSSEWSNYELKDGNFYTSLDSEMGVYRFGRLSQLQLDILAHGRKQGNRTITAVVDKVGGTGKTFLARWCALNGKAVYIDGHGKASDIIADAYDIAKSGAKMETIIVDLTRNSDQNRADLWAAIEEVKNGFLKDRRYAYKEMWIKPPQVFVFSNKEPDWEKLSVDRWDKVFLNDRGPTIELWHRIDGTAQVRNYKRNN